MVGKGLFKILLYILFSAAVIVLVLSLRAGSQYVVHIAPQMLVRSVPLLLVFGIWHWVNVRRNKANNKLPNLFYFITPIYQVLVTFYI